MKVFPFTKTKQRHNKKDIYGFDIETYDNNKKLYCCSLYGDNEKKTFFDKDDFIEYIKQKRFWNSLICATNLQFDFLGIFHNKKEINDFSFLFRGSDLLLTRTYIYNKRFNRYRNRLKDRALTFLDTLNYAKLSVEQLGKILSIPKLEKPAFLGKKPQYKSEIEELTAYNMRDSEISQKAIKFFYNAFEELGATPKYTIASTSMSLFRNKYLKDSFYRHSTDIILEQFNAYYGGRTECFNRGSMKGYNVYDFNSLYPSVMIKEFPNPKTLRITRKNTDYYINNYDGISQVNLECPYMDYPLLPFRKDDKLIFPTGCFTGWYSHLELRKAIELGYTIKKVYKTHYYKENFYPFKEFIESLYSLRLKYKSEKSSMEKIVKLLMNSLYGKFAQKFIDKDLWIPCESVDMSFISKCKFIERVGYFFRVKKENDYPSVFSFPIWSLYTTAYGRLRLYDYLKKYEVAYCDTDSIFTRKEITDSKELGKLKYEYTIKEGIIVKPKFYGLVTHDGIEKVRIKGIGTSMDYKRFLEFIENPSIEYGKFMKFKESMRRGFMPNEIQPILKELSLDDNKREWIDKFNGEFQFSKPLNIENYSTPSNPLHKNAKYINNNELTKDNEAKDNEAKVLLLRTQMEL